MRILKNIVYCTNCQESIESKYRWDYVTCKCGRVSVDGGKDYLKRGWIEPLCWIEMSLFADEL